MENSVVGTGMEKVQEYTVSLEIFGVQSIICTPKKPKKYSVNRTTVL